MASQPIPAGQVVAIVSNGGDAGVLAADACAEARPGRGHDDPGIRSRLREVLPPGSALAGPVDTTDDVSAEAFREALHIAAAQDGIDAVIALVVRRGPANLIPVLAGERVPVPVAAVVLGQPEAIRLLPGDGTAPSVPAYAYPEAATRALARAARYGFMAVTGASTVPELENLRVADTQSIIDSFLARMPGGGWLPAGEADDLLRCCWHPDGGIPPGGRCRRGRRGGGPPGRSRGDQGGCARPAAQDRHRRRRPRHHGADEVRAAISRLQARFAGRLSGVLVEPMITGGIETIVGVVQEPRCSARWWYSGSAGSPPTCSVTHAARLAPLTGADADDLIHSIRAAPALLGRPGPPGGRHRRRPRHPAPDLAARRRPAAGCPLDLNPVIAHPRNGVVAVDARIRVTSRHLADPFLRQLPSGSRTTGEPHDGTEVTTGFAEG